jgi:hypothetical protein
MGSLGFPEVIVLVVMLLIYTIIPPLLLVIAVRIFVYFAEMFGVPEALGRFAAPLIASFREARAPDEQTGAIGS